MSRKSDFLRSELPVLLAIVLSLFAARSSLADHYYVPSGSMEFTLMAGDRVFVNKMAYGLRIPFTKIEIGLDAPVKRGDVAIFDSPSDDVRLIKRVVAVGGDIAELREGSLWINGEALSTGIKGMEKFGDRLVSLNLEDGGGPELGPSLVPEDYVLAIGDHRGRSLDGRYFGFVAQDQIYAKAIGIFRRKSEGFVWRKL